MTKVYVEDRATKGQPGGYCELDPASLVPAVRLDASRIRTIIGAGQPSGVADLNASGFLPLSRLSGITGTQLSANAGIARAQIGALGITDADVAPNAGVAESKLALASDAQAAVASRRTLGTGPQQAAAGNDARLSDARTPTAHKTTHAAGGSDALSPADIGAIPTTDKGATNGVAELVGGLLPTSRLPALAINDTFTVASQTAMLALTAQRGDVAVRTDLSQTYILAAEPASTLANWTLLPTPPDAVSSVNGQTGVVNLSAANVGAKPSSYVPAWTEITGKPLVYPPDIGAGAAQAVAGNDARVANAEQTGNKNIAGGYAGLNASTVVPPQYLATGTRDGTKFLRDDGTYAVPASAGGGYTTAQDEGTGLPARPVLDFVGAGVTASDDGPNGRTLVSVPGNSHASDTAEGINYMSVAPASAARPVAVGDNDPRVNRALGGFLALANTATTITASATFQQVTYDNEVVDVEGDYNPATSTYTARRTGFYQFVAGLEWPSASVAAAKRYILQIYVNGTGGQYFDDRQSSTAQFLGTGGAQYVNLNAGDQVTVRAWQNNGANMATGTAGVTRFGGRYLGGL